MTQQQHERLKELLQAVIDTNRRLEETKQLSRNEQANVLRAQSELDKYLISVGGEAAPAQPQRKRRSDFGTTGVRKLGMPSADRSIKEHLSSAPNAAQPTIETVRERLQPSLSGLPDENGAGE